MDSTKYFEAAATLDRFANQFRAVLDLANHLRDAGSIQQAAQEAESRHRIAESHQAQCTERFLDLQGQIAAAEKRLAEVQAAAEQRISEADEEAREIQDRIERNSREAEATQAANAKEAAEQLAAKLAAAQAEADQALATTVALEAEVAAQVVARQAELDEIHNKIAKARDAARSLIEGV